MKKKLQAASPVCRWVSQGSAFMGLIVMGLYTHMNLETASSKVFFAPPGALRGVLFGADVE